MSKYDGGKKNTVVWKQVNRYMLWAGCVRKGHRPVLISCSAHNLMLYCEDCAVVWSVGTKSLSYMLARDWYGEKLGKR